MYAILTSILKIPALITIILLENQKRKVFQILEIIPWSQVWCLQLTWNGHPVDCPIWHRELWIIKIRHHIIKAFLIKGLVWSNEHLWSVLLNTNIVVSGRVGRMINRPGCQNHHIVLTVHLMRRSNNNHGVRYTHFWGIKLNRGS